MPEGTAESEGDAGFACTGRAIEEEMGETIGLDGVGESIDDFGLVGYFL